MNIFKQMHSFSVFDLEDYSQHSVWSHLQWFEACVNGCIQEDFPCLARKDYERAPWAFLWLPECQSSFTFIYPSLQAIESLRTTCSSRILIASSPQ